jgi:hypothetical protein
MKMPSRPTAYGPIWTLEPDELERALRFGREILLFELWSWPVWTVFLLAVVVSFTRMRRLPWQVAALDLLLLLGTIPLRVPAGSMR